MFEVIILACSFFEPVQCKNVHVEIASIAGDPVVMNERNCGLFGQMVAKTWRNEEADRGKFWQIKGISCGEPKQEAKL